MRPRAFLATIVLAVSAVPAGAASKTLLEKALAAKPEGSVDGILVLGRKRVVVGKDGRVLTRIHEVQRFLTDNALDEYGDPAILLRGDKQEVTIKAARSLRKDGKTTEATPNALSTITPDAVARAPWYSDVQETVVTLLGLEAGSAAELEAEIEDSEPYRGLVFGTEPLLDDRQVLEREISIEVPEGEEIAWHAAGASLSPEVEKAGGSTVYVFRFGDASATSLPEAGLLPPGRAPALWWMQKKGIGDLSSRLLAAAPYALGRQDAGGEADAILEQLAAETSKETWDPLQRALGYHRRVVDDLAPVEVDRAVFGDEVRPPSKAFQSGYADPIERLGILHTIFERMGYSPIPLVVLSIDPGGAMRLHPANIRGLWVRISVAGRYVYLDTASTAGTGEPRSGHVYVLSASGIEKADFVKPATTRMRFDAVADLASGVPVVKGTITLRGAWNPYWSILTSSASDPVETASSLLASTGMTVTQASFTRLALDETVVAFTASPSVLDGVVDLSLPSLLASVAAEWQMWRPDRSHPIVIEEKRWEKARLEVRLPEGASVLYSPGFEETGLTLGPISIFHTKGEDAKHVAVSRRVTLSPGEIAPDEAAGAKALLASALAPSRGRIVVKLPAE